jgi:hypothetical protein
MVEKETRGSILIKPSRLFLVSENAIPKPNATILTQSDDGHRRNYFANFEGYEFIF